MTMNEFNRVHNGHLRVLMILIGVLLTVLILLFSFMAVNALEEIRKPGDVRATITVTGEGSVVAVPDIAEFNFSVKYEADTVSEAQQEVAGRMDEIVSFLKEEGVDEKDIKTVGYSTHPRYEWIAPDERTSRTSGERVLVGYEVIHSTSIVVRDMPEAGRLVGGVGERGATNISGVTFSIDDENELKKEARSKAIEDAKNEAKSLAEDLNVRIIGMVEFNETGSLPGFMRADHFVEADTAMSTEPSFEPGEEKIVSEVRIKYEIR